MHSLLTLQEALDRFCEEVKETSPRDTSDETIYNTAADRFCKYFGLSHHEIPDYFANMSIKDFMATHYHTFVVKSLLTSSYQPNLDEVVFKQ